MRQRSGRERPARHPQGHARATILARAGDGIWLNEHIEADLAQASKPVTKLPMKIKRQCGRCDHFNSVLVEPGEAVPAFKCSAWLLNGATLAAKVRRARKRP